MIKKRCFSSSHQATEGDALSHWLREQRVDEKNRVARRESAQVPNQRLGKGCQILRCGWIVEDRMAKGEERSGEEERLKCRARAAATFVELIHWQLGRSNTAEEGEAVVVGGGGVASVGFEKCSVEAEQLSGG